MMRVLQIQSHIDLEIINFLDQNVLGTPGQSMVYRQLCTVDKLKHIPYPRFILLKRHDKILATCCLCKRSFGESTGYYVRYFSFSGKYRSGLASDIRRGQSILRDDIRKILSGTGLPDSTNRVFYAYLDLNNVRSARLCLEFGFQPIRTFSMLSFSRWRPKVRANVVLANQKDRNIARSLLNQTFLEYQFYTEENLFYQNNYYVLKDDKGEIIVGIQATKEHWDIQSLAGPLGKVMLNALSTLPWMNKLVSRNFHFLALEYIYIRPGYEQTLEELIESLLAIHQLNTCMIAVDNESSLYLKLKKLNLGPLSRIKKETQASVIVKTNASDQGTIEEMKSNPCFISTMDLT